MMKAAMLSCVLAVAPVLAAADAKLTRLYDLIAVDAYNQIIRDEGLRGADELAFDMIGRAADAPFLEQIDRIYDVDRLADSTRAALERGLDDDDIASALAYFETASAQRIVELEVAARRAISDEDVETAARAAWARADEDRPWLVARIREISQANDLLERNVAGALNSNLQFFKGLADGGGLEMTEQDMLAEVWGQEEDIRAETRDWLGAYLLLSYDPLSEADLDAYHTFWLTDAGKALNAAMFDGFDRAFDDISYATGRIIALSMVTQEL